MLKKKFGDEQNNISAFKQIFIEQFRFAVEAYF